MRRSTRALPVLLASLLAPLFAPLLGGCVLLAGAGAGLVISQEVLKDDAHVAHVQVDVDRAWAAAKETMNSMAFEIVDEQDYPHKIEGRVGRADVTVQVEAYDLDRSVIRVSAVKYMVNSAESADEVMQAILATLERDNA